METKKWEAMLTAVELGSFTRAAERLGLTQSGLTHMMNALEKEVGFPLLLRDRYGVRPTAAGERLLPAVQELMEANRRLEGQIAAQNSWKRENIRVAAYSSICMPSWFCRDGLTTFGLCPWTRRPAAISASPSPPWRRHPPSSGSLSSSPSGLWARCMEAAGSDFSLKREFY